MNCYYYRCTGYEVTVGINISASIVLYFMWCLTWYNNTMKYNTGLSYNCECYQTAE